MSCKKRKRPQTKNEKSKRIWPRELPPPCLSEEFVPLPGSNIRWIKMVYFREVHQQLFLRISERSGTIRRRRANLNKHEAIDIQWKTEEDTEQLYWVRRPNNVKIWIVQSVTREYVRSTAITRYLETETWVNFFRRFFQGGRSWSVKCEFCDESHGVMTHKHYIETAIRQAPKGLNREAALGLTKIIFSKN